jgi:hypothetical protein
MKKRRYMIMVGLVFSLVCVVVPNAWAQDSAEIINYQGDLKDNNVPMNDNVEMTFAIFDNESPGSDLPIWSETHSGVQISDGIFNVHLGSVTPFPADLFDTYDNLYLRITVGGETLTPLQQLTATPYAMKADTANHAHTATTANSVLNGTVTGDLLVGGSVGVGTSTPESLMHLSSMGGIDLIIEADTNNSGGEDQNARVVLRQDGGEVYGRLGYRHQENDLEIMQAFNDDLIFGTNNNDRMTIKNDGKIGIGTSIPEAKLHIVMPRGTLMPSTVGGLIIDDNTLNSGNQLEIRDETGSARMVVNGAGHVGIGTAVPETALAVRGNVTVLSAATGDLILELGEGLDYAEGFDVTDNRLEPGTVLAIDAENPGHLTMCRSAYDRKVAGIVAGAGGLGSGVRLGGRRFDQDVALAGRVYCKVDATNESIVTGDLLTTSGVTGHAMKVVNFSRAQGAVLGKAMEPLEKGKKGLILVLVTLQ